MTVTDFNSFLGTKIKEFLQLKRAAGYPYRNGEYILREFDRMIYTELNDNTHLSKQICETWIRKNSSLHNNTLLRKVTPIRQFGKYLLNCGEKAYIIPSGIPRKQIKYEPHIYTEKELTAFFQSADQCPVSVGAPAKHFVIPTLFRLLFTCGLRISEAQNLLISDVDLKTGRILIRESKGWSERIIYVHDEMLELLNRYHGHVQLLYPDSLYFFPNKFGNRISYGTLHTWFHQIWDNLQVADEVTGNSPRIHDFRHTFCVYKLNEWVRNNEDLSRLYPYLSEYVGHSNFSDTDYYLTLAEPFYPELKKRIHSINSSVLPEVLKDDDF